MPYNVYFNQDVIATAISVASNGPCYGWKIHNPQNTKRFLQIFNTNTVTPGTTTPTATIGIPPLETANLEIKGGLNLPSGFSICASDTPTGGTYTGSDGLEVVLFY